VEAAGIEPGDTGDEKLHNATTFLTKHQQIKTFEDTASLVGERQQTISEHQNDIFLHEKCVICVSDFPEDLRTIIDAWERLPKPVKTGILAMVNAVEQE
jgi:hypothetical protein